MDLCARHVCFGSLQINVVVYQGVRINRIKRAATGGGIGVHKRVSSGVGGHGQHHGFVVFNDGVIQQPDGQIKNIVGGCVAVVAGRHRETQAAGRARDARQGGGAQVVKFGAKHSRARHGQA